MKRGADCRPPGLEGVDRTTFHGGKVFGASSPPPIIKWRPRRHNAVQPTGAEPIPPVPTRPAEELDPPGILIAMAMAALAGATDVFGLVRLHDLFVSFMSGNTTMMALALGEMKWARAGLIAEILALFLGGVALGAAIGALVGRYHAAAVTLIVAVLLAVPLLQDSWTIPALTLAMGALNASMSRVGSTAISLTYVTGALVKFGNGVGHWLVGVKERRDWLLHAPIWLSLFAGAVGAALLQARSGTRWYWILPLFAALLVPLLALHSRMSTEVEME